MYVDGLSNFFFFKKRMSHCGLWCHLFLHDILFFQLYLCIHNYCMLDVSALSYKCLTALCLSFLSSGSNVWKGTVLLISWLKLSTRYQTLVVQTLVGMKEDYLEEGKVSCLISSSWLTATSALLVLEIHFAESQMAVTQRMMNQDPAKWYGCINHHSPYD